MLYTLGQKPKPTFYPEITKNLLFEKCEFCEKWDFEIVNFVRNGTLKLWILRKTRLWKCEFCEIRDFKNVNFVKMRLWNRVKTIFWQFLWNFFLSAPSPKAEPTGAKGAIRQVLWKMRFWKWELCENWGPRFLDRMWIYTFCPSVCSRALLHYCITASCARSIQSCSNVTHTSYFAADIPYLGDSISAGAEGRCPDNKRLP